MLNQVQHDTICIKQSPAMNDFINFTNLEIVEGPTSYRVTCHPELAMPANLGRVSESNIINNMHPVFKKFLLITLGYIVFVVGAGAGSLGRQWFETQKERSGLDKLVLLLEQGKEQEKRDFDGGKTADETMAMFIEAMNKGDLDLAQKYLGSIDAREKFKEMKDNDKMGEFVESLGRIKKRSDDEGYYMILDKNLKKLTDSIGLNPNVNGIWKITSL